MITIRQFQEQETAGMVLKQQLGLDNLKYVKVSRVMVSSYKILMVFYNSYRPTRPITNFEILKFPFVTQVLHGTDVVKGSTKKPSITPPVNLEDYNGSVLGSLIIMVDLSGYRFIDGDVLTKKFEKAPIKVVGKLNEFVTLADLKKQSNVSDTTLDYYKQRVNAMGGPTTNTKYIEATIDGNDVIFKFLSEATEVYPDDHVYYRIDPKSNNAIAISSAGGKATYEIWLKFLDVVGDKGWINTLLPTDKIDKNLMKDLINSAYVQLWCDDYSFTWQGFKWWLDSLDAGIYPETIKPKRWDKIHGDGDAFLTKHLWGLFKAIDFYLNQMAQSLNGLLKKQGYLPIKEK